MCIICVFNEGRTNVDDEDWSGSPTVITEDLIKKVDDCIHENRWFTTDELNLLFIHASWSVIYDIVAEKLHDKKICVRWIPKTLTEEHKKTVWLPLWCFWSGIIRAVAGDEIWICHCTWAVSYTHLDVYKRQLYSFHSCI